GRRSSARYRSPPSLRRRPRASPESKLSRRLRLHLGRRPRTKFQSLAVMVDAMNSDGPDLPALARKSAAGLDRGVPDPLFAQRQAISTDRSRLPKERSRWLAA